MGQQLFNGVRTSHRHALYLLDPSWGKTTIIRSYGNSSFLISFQTIAIKIERDLFFIGRFCFYFYGHSQFKFYGIWSGKNYYRKCYSRNR
mgnify:CR=1 FL=1